MLKQKKEIAELAMNGHSNGNTPARTPSQSSEESASDSEKETVRILDFFNVFCEETNLNFVVYL